MARPLPVIFQLVFERMVEYCDHQSLGEFRPICRAMGGWCANFQKARTEWSQICHTLRGAIGQGDFGINSEIFVEVLDTSIPSQRGDVHYPDPDIWAIMSPFEEDVYDLVFRDRRINVKWTEWESIYTGGRRRLIFEGMVYGPGCHHLLVQVMVLTWMRIDSSSEEEDDEDGDEEPFEDQDFHLDESEVFGTDDAEIIVISSDED